MAKYRIVEELLDGAHYAYKVQRKVDFNGGWEYVTFYGYASIPETLKECEAWIKTQLKPKPVFSTKVIKEYG